MFIIPNYVICKQIHENTWIRVYRGYTIGDKAPVLIKTPKEETSNSIGISFLMNEYEITRNLNIEGIIKPMRLEQAGTVLALVTKDIGAVTLKKYIQNYSISLPEFLQIAIQLAKILDRLHQKGIIHRDLKPENILITTGERKVYITNFSSAVFFSDESKNSLFPNDLAGTSEYMSPEQICRLDVGIDKRSDLYSLGVVFYEIVTGQLPLQAKSPAEWMYAHTTQIPQPPIKVNPNIPLPISDIIMKLLAKSVDERYQSAYGLLYDLKECERLLFQTGRIEFFPIGNMDASARFQLPQNLYGRKEEVEVLRAAFESVCEGRSETILVSGYPGVGKTMLINECLKPIAAEKGYFITGKFDQLEHNMPYAPIADAFSNLIKQLLTEDKEEVNKWRKKILYVLGRSGSVITDIIPELECIIGKQQPVDPLPPKEAENRFFMVFRNFVKIFAWKGHPLVLFLDDLQWVDTACMRLLKYLARDANLHYILFVGAFRDNEVNENHPLAEILKGTSKKQSNRKHIPLMPLEWNQVKRLVAEILHTDTKSSSSLSKILYKKSGGNPFLLVQLLTLIHDEGLLYFDKQKGCWEWELEAIQKLQPAEDMLESLLKKLQSLPAKTFEIIKLASCIGNMFDLNTLAAVCGKSLKETASCLMPAVLEGLVLTEENQKTSLSLTYPETNYFIYEFLDDRIRQAAYSLIPENEKCEKHLTIGRLLLQKTACSSLENKILPIMSHFNRSLNLIHDTAERMKLSEYNLLAGRKVKSSADHASALQYFRLGRTLLPDNAWEDAYLLTLDLHLELAQAEYLSANVKSAEELFDTAIEKSKDKLEQASIYGLKVGLYAGTGKYSEAVQTGIRALKSLGVKLPLHPTILDYAREMLLYKWYMNNKKIEDLVHLPEMEDPVQRKIAELFARLSLVAIHSHSDLFGYIILKAGNHAVRHGNTEMTASGYLGYSLTAGSILGDYEAGSRFGNVCIHLVEKYRISSSKCIIYFVIGACVTHWTRHASFGLEYLKKAVQSGMEAGDVLIIGYAHCLLLEVRFLLGLPLEELAKEIHKKFEIAGRLKHESLAANVEIYDKLLSALMKQKTVSLVSSAKEFQKRSFSRLRQNDQSSQATYYLYKMQLSYMAGNYRDALSAAKSGEAFTKAIFSFMTSAEYNFYYSLTITTLYSEMSLRDKKYYWKKLKKNQSQMKRWSEACKENFLHKYLLVDAEIARLQNKKEKAMLLYDQAIRSAQKNGYLQNEALANELAARFYLSNGLEKIARAYMLDACQGYRNWGALAKVEELKQRYSKFFEKTDFEKDTGKVFENIISITALNNSETASTSDAYFMDRVVENISKETDINKLLESFLSIATQAIGADRGYLILEKNEDLFIEATKENHSSAVMVKTIPLEENNTLSKAVVRYVARTLETIVLNYGEPAGIFAGDPYIAESKPKSIVCLPVLFQGIPFGVLYFENNFIPGIFTPERLESLKLLSAHIAYFKKLQSYLEKDEKDNKTAEKEGNSCIIDPLTERETDVLNLIAEGMSNKEIAVKLEITVNTVKGYIKNIYEKFGVNRRIQAITRAKKLGILKKN
jgi:predicted ATPase/DNA-binding CsgD family transcriptional regulator/GAF domain-containing protein